MLPGNVDNAAQNKRGNGPGDPPVSEHSEQPRHINLAKPIIEPGVQRASKVFSQLSNRASKVFTQLTNLFGRRSINNTKARINPKPTKLRTKSKKALAIALPFAKETRYRKTVTGRQLIIQRWPR
jgi:hypothetical protein